MIQGLDVAIIAATDLDGGIGKGGELPWHLPSDLKHFKDTTHGNIVVMGRKTYTELVERLGNGRNGNHVLPYRKCIVLSNTLDDVQDAIVIKDIKELTHNHVDILKPEGEDKNKVIFFIGGESVFELAMDYANYAIITEVKDVFDCDVQFNYNKFHKLFREYSYMNTWGLSGGYDYEIKIYTKKSQVGGWRDACKES